MPPADMFWGDRYGVLVDPFGHRWSIATHQRDLTPEELMTAARKWFAAQAVVVGHANHPTVTRVYDELVDLIADYRDRYVEATNPLLLPRENGKPMCSNSNTASGPTEHMYSIASWSPM